MENTNPKNNKCSVRVWVASESLLNLHDAPCVLVMAVKWFDMKLTKLGIVDARWRHCVCCVVVVVVGTLK